MRRKPSPKAKQTRPSVFPVIVLLVALAIAATIGLDFLNSRRGDKSYLFTPGQASAEPPAPPKPLREILTEGLVAASIPPDSIEQEEAPPLAARIVVRLALVLYEETEEFLDGWARSWGIGVTEKARNRLDDRIEITWRLKTPDRGEAEIVFVCPAEPPAKTIPKKPPVKAPVKKPQPGLVALIMDDMGNSLEVLNDILNLGEHITVAVLPFSTFARETAEIAHSRNLEVLLHLPLESQNNHDSAYSTEGMILAGMDENRILGTLAENIERVPFIRGVNNHMGSRLTAEPAVMRTILGLLKRKGLFFVDSRTTSLTVAYDEALRMGVPTTMRDVFLDADEDRGMIRGRLLELFRTAQKKGRAVGICHPFPETIKVLQENIRLLGEYDLEAVPVSRLLTGRD